MNFEEFYEKWESYPTCRVTIPGEGMWGRELPGGLIGIDNMPLHNEWQWQDIVKSPRLGEGEASVKSLLVHRRWHHKMYFEYKVTKGKKGDALIEQRKKIYNALKGIGHPGFWTEGVAYLLVQEADMSPEECLHKIKTALKKVRVTVLKPEA